MRILQIVPSVALSAGGVARVVIDLSTALAQNGHTVDLVTLENPPGGEFTIPDLPHLIRHDFRALGLLRHLVYHYSKINNLIAQADVVHIHGLWQPANYQIWKACRRIGKPVVLTVHGMLDPWSMNYHWLRKQLYYGFREQALIEGATLLHFTAELEKQKASPWYSDATPTVVIPPVVCTEDFDRLPAPDEYKKTFPQLKDVKNFVLFIGRIHPKKGLETLISAFARYAPQDPDMSLVIAGPGEPAYRYSLVQLIDRLGISARVHMLDAVNGRPKYELYRGAILFATISYQENFGVVFAESLSCKTPVLMTQGVDIYPDILEQKIGFITEPKIDLATQALSDILLKNRDKLTEFGERGRQWVLNTLSPQAVAERWVAEYQKLLHA